MPVARDDPFGRYNFVLEIEGIEAAGFTEVDGLTAETDVIEYREGADRESSARLLPGLASYGRVVLRRGFAGDASLYQWWRAVHDGAPERRNASIVLLDERREQVARWILRRAWPTKYAGPALNAKHSEVAIETLEIAHEGLELE